MVENYDLWLKTTIDGRKLPFMVDITIVSGVYKATFTSVGDFIDVHHIPENEVK